MKAFNVHYSGFPVDYGGSFTHKQYNRPTNPIIIKKMRPVGADPRHPAYRPLKRRKRTIYRSDIATQPRIRKALLYKGERKYRDVVYGAATQASGTMVPISLVDLPIGDGHDDRNGSSVHITGVDIVGCLGTALGQFMGSFIVSTIDGGVPVYGDFAAAMGGYMDPEKGHMFYKRVGGNSGTEAANINLAYRFRHPVKVIYQGTAAGSYIRNPLFFCLKNDSGANITGISVFIRIHFQDS